MKTSTINKKEIEKFSRIAEEWWDPTGKFKPLHKFNPIRISYIKEKIISSFKLENSDKPLQKIRLLDIGCGGGLLSEPMSRLGAEVTGIDASEKNIQVAKLHAKKNNLKINYLTASPENLKVDRKFDYLINILGADHAGYIKRITSSVEALSGKKDKLICKISQLVKLIKNKKPFKMSKRKGDYITVDDLIEEVGKDATRFIMLNRSSDVELDFDFDAVKEKSKDNPLYYVQYCYARISSVFRHINKDLNSKIELNDFNFEYSNDEIKILKKLSEWPKCIDSASTKLEPHRIPVYLYDLASEFHSYWNLGKQFPEKRFINDQKTVSPDKLIFLKAISNVIKTGMDIVGVDTPNQM